MAQKHGTLNITVVDPLNRPIKGATVQIMALNMKATTDATGKIMFRNIPYGTQIIKVTTA